MIFQFYGTLNTVFSVSGTVLKCLVKVKCFVTINLFITSLISYNILWDSTHLYFTDEEKMYRKVKYRHGASNGEVRNQNMLF